MIVKRADPSDTSRCVRIPASRSRSSRSKPTAPPSAPATERRSSASQPLSAGISLTRSCNGLLLEALQVLDPGCGQVEQLVEPGAVERHLLRRRLHFDETSVVRHDDVDVDVRVRVLGVVEVEQGRPLDHADRDGGDAAAQRLRETEPVERATRCDIRTCDRGTTRAAVGLQHVAVEIDGALAECLEVDDAAQRAADQPLDLDRPPALLAPRGLPVGALTRRGGQQRVLGRHPAAPGPVEPARYAVLDRGRAEHAGLPLRPEDDPVRLLEEARIGLDRAKLVWPASVVPAHTTSNSATWTCSTSPSGNCRNRSPSERKSAGSPVVRKRYTPSRETSLSKPLRASVSATSRAVSSAEKTSVTSRPKVRWKTGRSRG